MKKLGEFTLQFKSGGSKKSMPVEVLLDQDNTMVIFDCSCCQEIVSSRLPGGVMIPIASTLKMFFEAHGMRNADVRVSGNLMRRIYKGSLDESLVPEMRKLLETRVTKFSKMRGKKQMDDEEE
jgi:hypothetical protein